MSAVHPAPFSRSRLASSLAILFFVNVLNMMDRSILSVLLEPIRRDMRLTDTQIGLLTGFAFALFYAVAGVFIARLSDLYDRRVLLGVSILAWSAMTALTGGVNNFLQFFLARMGVGIGESSAVPTSNALIADLFPPTRRSLALAVFTAGSFLGVLLGSMLGGYVGAHYGWRLAFYAAALPGIPLALLTFAFLRDPPRGGSEGLVVEQSPALVATLRALAGNTAFLLLILSSGFVTFMLFGVIGWFPAFLMRVHLLDQATVGFFFGSALGLGTAVGALVGGLTANLLAARSLRWLTLMPLLLSILLVPLYEIAIHASNSAVSLVFVGLVSAVGGAMLGPVLAAIQTVLPANMRATGSGFTGFSGSLIGLGGAPLIVGMLSDHFGKSMGSGPALQHALAIAVLTGFAVTIFLFFADRAFAQKLAAADPNPLNGSVDTVAYSVEGAH